MITAPRKAEAMMSPSHCLHRRRSLSQKRSMLFTVRARLHYTRLEDEKGSFENWPIQKILKASWEGFQGLFENQHFVEKYIQYNCINLGETPRWKRSLYTLKATLLPKFVNILVIIGIFTHWLNWNISQTSNLTNLNMCTAKTVSCRLHIPTMPKCAIVDHM